MDAFVDEYEVSIPRGTVLDYITADNLPSRIEDHRRNHSGFILVDGVESVCRKIYKTMPVDWQEDYHNPDNPDEETGGMITVYASSETSRSTRSAPRDWRSDPRRIWLPPSEVPVSLAFIAENKQEAPEPTINGLLGKSETLAIAGTAGIGKSLLTIAMSHSLANNTKLWGKFGIPRSLTSLIVQSEVGGFAQRDRLNKQSTGNPGYKSDQVFILGSFLNPMDCRTSGKLDDPEFQATIRNAIIEVSADVLFIDPFISFNPVNENDNTEVRRVLDSLEYSLKDTGVSIVLIHHSPKGASGFRGASAIRDWAANTLILELDRMEAGEARIKVTHDKGRNFEQVDPFYLNRTKNLSFELAENKSTEKEDPRLECVVSVLKAAGGRIEGQKQFVQLIEKAKNGAKDRTARSRIRDARDCDLIIEIDKGNGGQKLYKLPQK